MARRPTRALLVLLLFCALPAGAQPPAGERPDFTRARQLLELRGDQELKTAVENLTPREATDLISQVLYLSRERDPNVDQLYALVRHLESIRATAIAQKQLDQLLLVLGLTLVLFTGFVLYVLLDQRRSIRALQALLARSAAKDAGPVSVYRGESS